MSTFPNFSNIAKYIQKTLESRRNNPLVNSSLNAWIKVTSGTSTSKGNGLVMYSNPNMDLFKAAGDDGPATIYGSSSQSGALGVNWENKAVIPSNGVGLRPSPIIESMEVDEGAGNLSRKASFSIKCFSLEQMELVTNYFLEPGFTIFLEWGQNHPDSMRGITKSNASDIASHQNFKILSEKRRKSKGTYDNYLGYITGGSTEVSGEVWTVNVKCTGFMELPAYLINGDNSGAPTTEKEQKIIDAKGKANEYGIISKAKSDINRSRWMMMYNILPSNRKTKEIKNLETAFDDGISPIPMAHAVNFINFDESIRDEINRLADGTMAGRLFGYNKGVNQDGKSAKLPAGTKLVPDDKYIRFGTLMKIINTIIAKSYKVGSVDVPLAINSSISICGAYPHIFSLRNDKLFIPNSQSPKFDLVTASDSDEPLSTIPLPPVNNEVDYGYTITFPSKSAIKDGIIVEDSKSICYTDDDIPAMAGIQKDAYQWGLLDNLYVNFEFATGVLETSNLSVMDALYQLLNGMSSAVNDLWNFQIISTPAPAGNSHGYAVGTNILTIIDANFTYKDNLQELPYQFNLIGTDSIFKEANFNMEMSGAKMNQIIGTRLNHSMSKESQPYVGKLFSEGNTDLILKSIELNKPPTKKQKEKKLSADEIKELKARFYDQFLGRLSAFPKVRIYSAAKVYSGFELNKTLYVSTYDDSQLLKLAKIGATAELSPILPITFSFTISGVSGIKRGDKFRVVGIPKMYYENGFFQVVGVSHSISGMSWNTTVEGAYRRKLKE